MATPKLDYDKAAAILVDAEVMGDKAAGEKHGVAPRTIERYRTVMNVDEKLAEAVGKLTPVVKQEHWLASVPPVFRRIMEEILAALDREDVPLKELVSHAEKIGQLVYTAEYLAGASARVASDRAGDESGRTADPVVTAFRKTA